MTFPTLTKWLMEDPLKALRLHYYNREYVAVIYFQDRERLGAAGTRPADWLFRKGGGVSVSDALAYFETKFVDSLEPTKTHQLGQRLNEVMEAWLKDGYHITIGRIFDKLSAVPHAPEFDHLAWQRYVIAYEVRGLTVEEVLMRQFLNLGSPK